MLILGHTDPSKSPSSFSLCESKQFFHSLPLKNFQENKEARQIPGCQFLIQKHIFTEIVEGVSGRNRKLCKIISEDYLSVVT